MASFPTFSSAVPLFSSPRSPCSLPHVLALAFVFASLSSSFFPAFQLRSSHLLNTSVTCFTFKSVGQIDTAQCRMLNPHLTAQNADHMRQEPGKIEIPFVHG